LILERSWLFVVLVPVVVAVLALIVVDMPIVVDVEEIFVVVSVGAPVAIDGLLGPPLLLDLFTLHFLLSWHPLASPGRAQTGFLHLILPLLVFFGLHLHAFLAALTLCTVRLPDDIACNGALPPAPCVVVLVKHSQLVTNKVGLPIMI
jgi:hypothetical protein